MKIEGINPATTELPLTGPNRPPTPPCQYSGCGGGLASFHSDSASVQLLTSQALNSPEIRQGTVDALRQSVSSGQYQVDATNIAGAIATSGQIEGRGKAHAGSYRSISQSETNLSRPEGVPMNDVAVQTHDQLAASYLQHLQALALEISVAMDAIAANALTRLRESVANRKCSVPCWRSWHMPQQRNPISQPSLLSPNGVSSDASLTRPDLKIRATSAAIRQLNLQYAALLKHSGKSIDLLASLCRTHTGQLQEARGPRSKRQTWSCEM